MMGDLVHISDLIGQSGEPSERAALARISSALGQVEREIEALLIGQDKLEAQMGQGTDLKQDLAEKIVAEASAIVALMKKGVAWTLGQTGTRATRKSAELLSVSSIQMAVGEATREKTIEEIQRLEAKRERLLVARAGIVRETIRESLQPALLEDYAATLAHLQSDMIRLEALRRLLSPPSHDYRPDAARLAVIVPDFASGSGDTAVVATAQAIGQMESRLHAFMAELERDPRAAAPELQIEVDDQSDADTPYDQLSPPERRAADAAFSLPVNTHRRTVDAELFESQLAEAKAFVGFTN
jgi:hypothetical protein